jgi:hypothetical protein
LSVWHFVALLTFSIYLPPRLIYFYPLYFGIPAIGIFVLLFFCRIIIPPYPLIAICLLFVTSLITALVSESYVFNVVLSIATYGTIFFLLIRPYAINVELESKLFGLLLILMAGYQVIIGLWQSILTGFPFALPYRNYSPDVFKGTLGAGGHQLVTALFVAAFFWLQGEFASGGRRSAVWMLLMSILIVLPGSVATIVCFVLAIILNYIFWPIGYRGARELRRYSTVRFWLVRAAILIVFVGGSIISGNLNYLNSKLFEEQRTPDGYKNARIDALVKTMTVLPVEVPYQPVVGVGLGNYSSWSQLLLSGVYGEKFIRGFQTDQDIGLPILVRKEAWENVLVHMSSSYLDGFGRWYVESVFTQPFWTWQSLYAETGVIGVLIICYLLFGTMRMGKITSDQGLYEQTLRRFIFSYLIFFVCMCFVDNYFEYPWVTYPLMLALVLGSASSRSAGDTIHPGSARSPI